MLDTTLKAQLQGYLERLAGPIELVATLNDSPASAEMLELLHEIAGLTTQIVVHTGGTDERAPSFGVARRGEEPRVRFAGIPLGHEFTSLVLALLQVSGYPPKVEAELIEHVKALDADLNFVTYVSLSCHNCPDVVQAFNLMAALNPKITHTMVDGALFQDEVNAKNILAVPAVHLNGKEFGAGPPPTISMS